MTRFEKILYVLAVGLMFAALAYMGGIARAHAKDWEESEGKFMNRSELKLACYGDDKNHPGKVCRRHIAKGETCLGDAIGTGDGAPVFKVPNRSRWFADYLEGGVTISPQDQYSWLLLDAARAFRKGKYGWLTWTTFVNVMGKREIVNCDEEGACT